MKPDVTETDTVTETDAEGRKMHVKPGSPYPLGATYSKEGTNFALFAENATAVTLCLFGNPDDGGEGEEKEYCIPVTEVTNHIWHIYVPDVRPGQLYAYRVDGPYEPDQGHRFNKNKVLIDPYARAITGSVKWDDAVFGYEIGHADEDRSFSETDSAPFIPKGVILENGFDWEGDRAPKIPYHDLVIYEAHVKGLTWRHPDIPETLRGTFAALGHPTMIDYLKQLGINALELMPVHQFETDRTLAEKELKNYWGYNTLGFFAPHAAYSSSGNRGEQVTEFRNMVKALHKAGIEVILDVVYNHTAEGNHFGPTFSFKGIDNASYYRLKPDERRYYMDYTGTGNTMNVRMPFVLTLIMDSLRYWVNEMHVDGFRFDLAAALARTLHETDNLSAFFLAIQQDPVISQVKLIAEPWDIGEKGYLVGKFPPGWAEWNGMYRDCIRDYWRGGDSRLSEFALRFSGSPDLYQGDYRMPTASINFITAHDGFTLHDLVSYNGKHNEANKEENRDGQDENHSWNCGHEGPTDNPDINALRLKQKRNMLITLFLSQGVPMLTAGDEIGKTQHGNNNAYCQDNEISWVDWESADQELLDFTRQLIRFCQDHHTFHRRRWFQGTSVTGKDRQDIHWYLPDGSEMQESNWNNDFAKSLGVFLNGKEIRSMDYDGNPIVDDHFYLIFNAWEEPITYTLPCLKLIAEWEVLMDSETGFREKPEVRAPESKLDVAARSVVILQGKEKEK